MSPPDRPRALANRNYRLYFVGQVISQTGTWMQIVAEGWLVLELGGSVASLGLVNFAFALPSVLLSLFGGALADRGDRRRIAIVTQTVLMLIALAMTVLVAKSALSIWLIGIAAFAGGAASAYDLPARQALIPQIVSPRDLPQAMALNQVAFNGSRLLGPALAAGAIHQFGLTSAYLGNALSFVAAIASLVLMRVPEKVSQPAKETSMFASIREGLAYSLGSRLLRGILLALASATLLVFPALAVLPPAYARTVLHGGPATVGALMAVSGGASMVGAFVMMGIPNARRGHAMVVAVLSTSVALVTMAFARSTWTAGIGIGLLASGFSLLFGLAMVTIQQTVPDALRGRVSSVAGLTFSAVLPFAGLGVSMAVERLGFVPVFLVNAAIYTVVGVSAIVMSGMIGFVPPPPATER